DTIAGRKGGDQRLKGGLDLLRDLRRLGRLIDVRAYRDDGGAIAALQNRLFKSDFRMADLIERNRAAVPARQRKIRQTRRIEPLAASAARHDGDIADVLANLRNGDAGEEELELPAHLGRRKADEVQSILIRDEAEYGRAITPVAIRLPHIGNATHAVEGR